MKRLVLVLCVALPLCILAGAVYNTMALRKLQTTYRAPGDFYNVGGHPMHIYCTGSGSPTVVLESGLGNDWISWQKVQPEIAKTTRVCSYDRAGLGWSAPQEPPRDAQTISQQLHYLLLAANEKGPFVLVGASAGGFYVRQYASSFPAEVAGIVFVDSSVPEQLTVFPGRMDTDEKRGKRHRGATLEWFKVLSGWQRLRGRCDGTIENGLESYRGYAAAESCRPIFTTAWLGEYDAFWQSAEEAAKTNCCGNIPLVIVSQDPDRPKIGWDAESIAQQPMWGKLQDDLKRLSPHSRRIIARGSGHHVMIDRPEVVIGGIESVLSDIREHRKDPQEGTTIVE